MATITAPTPILDATPAMVAAVAALLAARQDEDTAAVVHGCTSREYHRACERSIEAEVAVEAAFPLGRVGWYPIAGRLWGRAKTDGTGLRLVNKAAAWGMEHPKRMTATTRAAR